MAKLNDVLGTILKDIAHSRVISDIFSRDVSVEYEQDPILADFPVPRVEIQQVSVQLKFAVNAVDRQAVDTESIINTQVNKYAEKLAQRVYSDVILEHPNKEKLLGFEEDKGTQLEKGFSEKVKDILLENPRALKSALEDDPQAMSWLLRDGLEKSLRGDADLWKNMKRGLLVREIQGKLERDVTSTVGDFAQDLNTELRTAERHALSVDVAVTRDELIEAPQEIVSEINVVAEIRNYEWTELGDVDETPVRRLRPE